MTGTKLYWVEGPWPGRLAISARPRGGEWIADEISSWRNFGVDTIISLLTPTEERDLNLTYESAAARSQGLGFMSFPIEDRRAPNSDQEVAKLLEKMDKELSEGRKLVLHCRQGVGRSGLVAAGLLMTKGWSPQGAIQELSAIRGVSIPETIEQKEWIEHFAAITNPK